MRTVISDARLSSVARRVAAGRAPKAARTANISDTQRIRSWQRAVQSGMVRTADVPVEFRAFVNL